MSSRTNTKRRNTNTPEIFVSGVFHGLKFFDSFDDNTDLDKPLVCIPEITLLENNTKALFDFSKCIGSSDFDQINVLMTGATLGDGITLNDGQHLDDNTSEESNISGTFTITGKYNRVIVADVVSVSSPQNYDKKYKSRYFLNFPEIYIGASNISNTNRYLVKNFFNTQSQESFIDLGVRPTDSIRFNNGTNSGKLFEIVSIEVDENDHELLGITGGTAGYVITEENRFNQETNFDIFRVDSTEEESNQIVYANPTNGLFVLLPQLNLNSFKYFFDGFKQPSIRIERGSTYIFNKIGSSFSFSLSSTPDGIWNGGVDLPDIIETQYLLIYTPKSSNKIYYYDKLRSGAGGEIIITDILPSVSAYSINDLNVSTQTTTVPLSNLGDYRNYTLSTVSSLNSLS